MGVWVIRTDLAQNRGLLFADGVVLLFLHALDRDGVAMLHVQRSALRHESHASVVITIQHMDMHRW